SALSTSATRLPCAKPRGLCLVHEVLQPLSVKRVLIRHGKNSGGPMSKASVRFAWILLALAASVFASLPAMADSQARIVRLSDVQGSVQIDKNTGLGFESAFLNLPVTQGAEIKTGADGRAEGEVEDGSTLRLTPGTTIEFSTLNMNDSGQHVSVLHLHEGLTYVNWLGKSGDHFTLEFGHEKLSLTGTVHFRVNASAAAAKLAVF